MYSSARWRGCGDVDFTCVRWEKIGDFLWPFDEAIAVGVKIFLIAEIESFFFAFKAIEIEMEN